MIDTRWEILSICGEHMEENAVRQNLRDNTGTLLGWRQQMGPMIRGYVARGWPVGFYDPAMNITYDHHGHRVGTGDWLASLIVSGR